MDSNEARPRKVFVAGHRGLVGSAIVRRLSSTTDEVVTVPRSQLDLRSQADVNGWFASVRPNVVYLVAGTVGGIQANMSRPAEFIYDNIAIHSNVIHAAYLTGVDKLLYVGSSCIYPREAAQPMREESLLAGPLEPTNEFYAIAKIAGIKMCQAYRRQYGCQFISAMPTNLYGPNDNFDLTSSHVLPALIRKFHEAKVTGLGQVNVWGSGKPRREFLHVDDLADGCVFLMEHYNDYDHVNIGTGEDTSISSLADMIRRIVYPKAELVFDSTKPDGAPRKVLDVGRIRALGWKHSISLETGVRSSYEWFVENIATARGVGYSQ